MDARYIPILVGVLYLAGIFNGFLWKFSRAQEGGGGEYRAGIYSKWVKYAFPKLNFKTVLAQYNYIELRHGDGGNVLQT